jgi:hypothetical protein
MSVGTGLEIGQERAGADTYAGGVSDGPQDLIGDADVAPQADIGGLASQLPHVPADVVLFLDQMDFRTRLSQPSGRRGAGDAAPHDQNPEPAISHVHSHR